MKPTDKLVRYSSKHIICDGPDEQALVEYAKTNVDTLKNSYVMQRSPGVFSLWAEKALGKPPHNLMKGVHSFAKKLGCDPSLLTLVNVKKGSIMPDEYFGRIHMTPETVDEMVKYAQGTYTREMIKAKIGQTVRQAGNKRVISAILDGGAAECVKEGILSVGQASAAQKFYAQELEKEEKRARLARDVERRKCMKFECHITGKSYRIESFKGDGLSVPSEQAGGEEDTPRYETDEYGEEWLSLHRTDASSRVCKRKHHYFYSKRGGYGKTDFLMAAMKYTNADLIKDTKNMTGVSEDAQFLFVDEYGPKRRFEMDDLKGLTSGSASAFTGNKKSYGASYSPRPDVQLIILSNDHLFECMGTYDRSTMKRVISQAHAHLLRQRFFIHRLDETETSTEATDGDAHTRIDLDDLTFGEADDVIIPCKMV